MCETRDDSSLIVGYPPTSLRSWSAKASVLRKQVSGANGFLALSPYKKKSRYRLYN